MKFAILLAFTLGALASGLYSQSCNLLIEVTADSSDTAIKGVSATAISRVSSRLYRSSFMQGFPYFANLPEGEYVVTVKKVGYKQTVDNLEHVCEEAVDGTGTAYFSLWKGQATEKVDLTNVQVMRENVKTILGDVDVPAGRNEVRTLQSDDDRSTTSAATEGSVASSSPKIISGGVLNGKATNLPKPEYPAAAMAVKAAGAVSVQVLVNEDGRVISAVAVSGHPLLRAAAESAARGATFSQTMIGGQPVKVSGVVTYSFVP